MVSAGVILPFVLGFILLLKGADILTGAATDLAKKFRVPAFIVGVVIVGIGTSIPELVVAVLSNAKGLSKISLGTVIGSNTFNILVILGIAALIAPLQITKTEMRRHLPLNAAAVILAGLLVVMNGSFFGLTRIAGLFLIAVFGLWLFYLARAERAMKKPAADEPQTPPAFIDIVLVITGLIGITIGGEWVTEYGATLARALGMGEAVIGLTVIGIGTSLPELFASAVAAWKKQYALALGNVIGSNIFDFLLILGLSAAMRPLVFTPALFVDLWVTAGVSILLLVAIMVGKRYTLGRVEGVVFILIYVFYLWYLITWRAALVPTPV